MQSLTLLVLVSSAFGSSDQNATIDLVRLPKSLKPLHYDLEIITNLRDVGPVNLTFSGRVRITCVAVTTGSIHLHCDQSYIKILDSKLIQTKDNATIPLPPPEKNGTQICYPLDPGVIQKKEIYELEITYEAKHPEDKIGFYKTEYNSDGTTRPLLVTFFQPVYARTTFPCFDEPHYKATFSVSVAMHDDLYQDGYHVLSNAPLERTYVDENNHTQVWFQFEKTPHKMSTYLLGIVVSDLTSMPPYIRKSGTKIKAWSSKELVADGLLKYAELASVRLLAHQESIFNFSFVFPKIDIVGIPGFPSLGMESFGLLLVNEDSGLVLHPNATAHSKQVITQVLSHELVHSWFGNIVTLRWWDNTWLNEGLATYFEYFSIKTMKAKDLDLTSWDMDGQFVSESIHRMFMNDAYEDARPVSGPVTHVQDYLELFHSRTYKKGGAIVRMLHHIVGYNTFIKGIKHYLNSNAYSTVMPDDFFNCFDWSKNIRRIPLNITVNTVIKNWISTPGFPVVNVKRDNGRLTLTQERFLNRKPTASTNQSWIIPVNMVSKEEDNFADTIPKWWVLDPISIPAPQGWYIFNVQQIGYYRVNYDPQNWSELIKVLRDVNQYKTIHHINRAMLLDDAFSLAFSTAKEYLNYSTPLVLGRYMKHEDQYMPWVTFTVHIMNLRNAVASDETMSTFLKTYVQDIVEDTYKVLTNFSTQQTHLKKLHTEVITTLACEFEYEPCLKDAKNWFKNRKTFTYISQVKSAAYCIGIRHGTEHAWRSFWEEYLEEDSHDGKLYMLKGLGCTSDERILLRYMTRIMDNNFEEKLRAKAFKYLIEGNARNITVIYKFIKKNIDKMAARIPNLEEIIDTLAEVLFTHKDLEAIKYLKKGTNSVKFSKILNKIHTNINWSRYKLTKLQVDFDETKLGDPQYSLFDKIKHLIRHLTSGAWNLIWGSKMRNGGVSCGQTPST